MYHSEEEFLKNYDSSKYEKISLTTDILLFSVSDISQDNYRKTNEKAMSVLLVKRKNYPYKDMWCLPGGFLDVKEELEDCPKRILEQETNLKNIYMEQLYTFGGVTRDPRMRIVSTAYMGLIDKNILKDTLANNAKWFQISYEEKENKITLLLTSEEETIKIKAKKVRNETKSLTTKYQIIENKKLAFDHAEVILTGIERLRNKIEYTDIVFHMMPKYFTLGELQKVYEVILGKTLLMPAFRRMIASKVEKTEKMETGGGHRPSSLFEYKNREKI